MSRSEERKPGKGAEEVRAVEAFWQAKLPEAFCKLYAQPHPPFLAPCEFFALSAIAKGAGRSFGMLPQYLPFGRAVGEGGLYGFYVTPEISQGQWPVLYWDEDEMYLRPVASSFDAFLAHCVLVGRYETEAQWEDGDGEGREERERSEILTELGVPESVGQGSLPRN